MSEGDARAEHWEMVYRTKATTDVSWYQPTPLISLELVERSGVAKEAPLVDVGAGASTLVDGLLDRGHRDISLLDVAGAALERTKERLGDRGAGVHYLVADVTTWRPERTYALWHDRAVFHFLTEPAQRAAYLETMKAAMAPGARAIIATFAEDGPERCSGLPVRRYSAAALAAELAPVVRLIETRSELHHTPSGATQSFVYALFEQVLTPMSR